MFGKENKLGLVLEGGGVKGAYQVGALTAIKEIGVEFDGVVGTSIGAINGALYLEGGYAKLLEVWKEIKTNTVYALSDEEIEALHNLEFTPAILKVVREKKLKTVRMLEESYKQSQDFFRKLVHEDVIRASGKDFGVVAFDVTDFQPFERMMDGIENGKLVDYIIASATFPIFPPKSVGEKKYVDGGVYDNMPINLLARSGYDKMLVIRTNTMDKPPKRKIERGDIDMFFIAPERDLGPAMAFSERRVHDFLQCGYDDAKRLMQSGLKEFLLS